MATTQQIEAKDVNGQPLSVGDVCVYIGTEEHRIGKRGAKVIVRAVSTQGTERLRVDDDVNGNDVDNWTWSAWVSGKDLARCRPAGSAPEEDHA
jgi:hypothetical protein